MFGKKKWYWVSATQDGRTVLLAPAQPTESKARAYAQEMLGGNFYTVEEYDTADQTKATREHRAKLLKQSGNLGFAISRMSHKVKKENTEEDQDNQEQEMNQDEDFKYY